MQIIALALVVFVLVCSLRVIWDFLLADLLTILDYINADKSGQSNFLIFYPADLRKLRRDIHAKDGR
jgi:hypothetical protein